MTELLLLPTLERLSPYSEKQPAVGLVFSVALKDGTAYQGDLQAWMYEFLRPWSWMTGTKLQAIDEMKVYSRKDDSSPWSDRSISIRNDIPEDALYADGLSALRSRLDHRFGCFKDQGGNPWVWPPENDRVHPEARPWPAFLGELSLLPWPLAQSLGMSFFYSFKEQELPADATLLIAAPVLKLGADGQGRTLIPGVPSESVDYKGAWELKYAYSGSEVTGLKVTAVTRECSLAKPRQNPIFLDLETLWVKKSSANDGDLSSEDWRQGLELRLASELNPARLQIDFMRDQPASILAPIYPVKVMEVLKELQKVSFPVLGNGFIGGNLLRRVAPLKDDKRAFDDRLISKFEEKAQPELDKLMNDHDRWLGWVEQTKFPDGQIPEILARARKNQLDQISLATALDSLDRLVVALQDATTMTPLFQDLWKAIKPAAGNWDAGSQDLLKALIEGKPPAGINLGVELLRARVGSEWKDVLKTAFDSSLTLPQARETLRQQIEKKLAGFSASWAGKKAPEIVSVLLPEPSAEASATSRPTGSGSAGFRATRGLTFQVDTLAADDQAGDDVLQKIQGIAVLARKKGQEWCCLNLAEARVGDLLIADRVLLPSRLAYLNGLRTATLTYDNQPLTVPGPLAAANVSGVSIEPGIPDSSPLDEPLVDYGYSRMSRLPGLAFGQTYEILPFIVTNSGVFPKELASSIEQPGRLELPVGDLGSGGQWVRSHQYKREVHVGALRFVSSDAAGLPPIPAGVSPRVRELPAMLVLPPGDPLLTNVDIPRKPQQDPATKDAVQQTDSILAGTPLLLLAPKSLATRPGVELRDELSFRILPPTIDLQTWDRWVAGTKGKEHRRLIWRSFYQQSYERGEYEGGRPKGTLETQGVYLDDPAVIGFWVELSAFDEEGRTMASVTGGEIPLGDPRVLGAAKGPDGTDLSSEQHDGMKVLCSLADGRLKVEINGKGLPPLSQYGSIYRLSIYARIDSNDQARFRWKEAVLEKNNHLLTSPWHLFIEIPQALPEGQDFAKAVFDALQPKAPADGENSLTVDLDLSSIQALKHHLHRAELWHQVWSWRGRPPAPWPALDSKGTPLEFEMSEFGERSDDEHARRPMGRLPQSKPQDEPAGSAFRFEMNLNELEPQGNIRALYHRFSARVFSRWETILPESDGFFEAMNDKTMSRWTGLFVPCRHTGNVPVPKIKLVLPLTQGNDQGGPPGLLVVVDGSWYEVGGLAERLGVEVMTVTGPDSKDGTVKSPEYYQIGTDPIVTAKSAGEALKERGALRKVKEEEFTVTFDHMTGAIGHQRDRSRTDPYFLASSFLLPQPTIRKGREERKADLSWWFVKLRFFRKLLVGGVKESPVSELSAPFWVQFLPGMERVEDSWFGTGSHDLALTRDRKTLRVQTDGKAQGGQKPFYLFGVMTQKVVDFAGRPDQESYLCVWWMTGTDGKSWTTDQPPDASEGETLFIRWIEVQSAQPLTLGRGDELWGRLFALDPTTKNDIPPAKRDLERARIVRISKPFPVVVDKRPS